LQVNVTAKLRVTNIRKSLFSAQHENTRCVIYTATAVHNNQLYLLKEHIQSVT